ncbi:uncharacterized protein LOC125221369 [Salvia hispanica]|uniref:uncharacterized protein LOC125221369 n=1 Tax=Salvia hispanica TaxID=49212 RepID=UPI002008F519|nr:uncharacterized protein LOC125221369 [Salvia hispanica]
MLWTCRVSGELSSRDLDGVLQNYALKAFARRPKTGVAYDGAVSGIRVSAMRLKTGALKRRGVSMYQEFQIPKGVVTHPYVERLALLYHNLANWSLAYYPPLEGYTYLAPVIGLLAYDASQLKTRLDIRASGQPISINFSKLLLAPMAMPAHPKCVFFDVNGSVYLSDMMWGGICTTFQEGHYSVVTNTSIARNDSASTSSTRLKWWMIVGGVLVGALALGGVAVVSRRMYEQRMNKKTVAELSEAFYTSSDGTPAAMPTRTLPKLENEYVP